MKNLALLVLTVLGLYGCAASPAPAPNNVVVTSLPYLRPGAAVVTAGFLSAEKDPAKRAEKAALLYTASSAIYSLAGGQNVTRQDIETAVLTWTAKTTDPAWADFASQLTAVYASIYPSLALDSSAYVQAVARLAQGVQDAAKPR